MAKLAVGSAIGIIALGALIAGTLPFTVVVLVLAAVLVLDLSFLLARGRARPVLPVVLFAGLALPAMAAADVARDPASGWDRLPGGFAVVILAAFLLVLLFGRRGGAVVGLSATAMSALVIGLGAGGLLLLRGLPNGFRWVLATGALVIAADIAAPAVRALRRRRFGPDDYMDGFDDQLSAPLDGVLPALVAVAVVGALLWALLDGPLEPLVTVLLAVVAVVSALGGDYLQRALSTEAGVDPDGAGAALGQGVIVSVLDALVLAAPAAYVVARSVAL